MNTRSARRRTTALIAAATLASGSVVALTVTPAAAVERVPTNLEIGGHPCAPSAPGTFLPMVSITSLRGTFQRPEGSRDLRAEFQLWNIATPQQPQEWTTSITDELDRVHTQLEDMSQFHDGVTYAWRVRVVDGGDAWPWSGACHFTVDRDGGAEPGVSSVEYPSGMGTPRGGIGVPGIFTLTAAADDTVRYRYRFSWQGKTDEDPFNPYSEIDAEGLGGPATISFTPQETSFHSLYVYAVDRAGNQSLPAEYEFRVRETRPSVHSMAYNDHTSLNYNVGVPGAFELASPVADTASFVWRIDGEGPSGTAPADAEGKATVMIAPSRAGWQTLSVHAVTRDDTAHLPREYRFFVDNGPLATPLSDEVTIGSTATVRLTPRTPEVTAYLYWWQEGHGEWPLADKHVLAARPDGTADLSWMVGRHPGSLYVQSRSADGTISERRQVHIRTDRAAPTVTRTGGEDLGTAATITLRTRMSNATEYVVTLNWEAPRVIPAAPDGSATFPLTAPRRGYNNLEVYARNPEGVQTEVNVLSWFVTDSPQVSSTEFPDNATGRLVPGTFHLTPRLAGSTAFEYSFNGGPFASVAAGADGTAKVNYTPTFSGDHRVAVRSVTAEGLSSLTTTHHFTVSAALPTITSVSPTELPSGGLRKITIRGNDLHLRDTILVTPADGKPRTVRVTATSGTTSTGEVDLSGAPIGPATVTLRPYTDGTPMVLGGALTIAPPPALVAYTLPAIIGTVAVGNTVTVDPGEWSPAPTGYRYQWLANGIRIKGATGTSFKIPAVLVGTHLTVLVTAAGTGFTSAEATSSPMKVAKGKAPRATSAPTIVGTVQVGRTVQVDVGTWSPVAHSYRYEWRLDGKLVSDAKSSKLKLTSSMRNKRLTVTVIAIRTGHADGRATGKAVTVRG